MRGASSTEFVSILLVVVVVVVIAFAASGLVRGIFATIQPTATVASAPTVPGQPTASAVASPTPSGEIPTAIEQPTAGGPNLFDANDQALADSTISGIAYNAPPSMQLEQPTTIELLMNPSASPQALATQVSGPGPVVSVDIEITPLMKAELVPVDPAAFAIQPLQDAAVQVVSSKDTTRWQWSVTPKKEGQQHLTLIVYRQVKYQGSDYWRSVKSYETNIDVQVSFAQRVAGLDWKWIAGILVAFVTTAFWKWWDGRKKQGAPPHEPAKKQRPAKAAKHTGAR